LFLFLLSLALHTDLDAIKKRWPQLQVAHLGALLTAREYADVEREYAASKEVVLPERMVANGDVITDRAMSELCIVFPEMQVLSTPPGTVCSIAVVVLKRRLPISAHFRHFCLQARCSRRHRRRRSSSNVPAWTSRRDRLRHKNTRERRD